jgi:hypothetical protein
VVVYEDLVELFVQAGLPTAYAGLALLLTIAGAFVE